MENKKLNFEELKELVFKLDKATKKNKDRLFKLAKSSGNLEIIKKLRDEFGFKGAKVYLNKLNEHKMNEAIKKKDFISIKKLIEDGTSVKNIKLYNFLENVPITFIEFLVHNKVNLNTKDEYGNTALIIASSKGFYEIVEILVNNNANINIQNYNGDTALTFAIEENYINIIHLLLKNNVNINTSNKNGNTALITACATAHEKIALLLIENNAKINHKNKDGASALSFSTQNNLENIVDILIQKNVNVNTQNTRGHAPLTIASQNGYYNIVKLLLKNGANPNITDYMGVTSVMLSVDKLNYKILKLLLDNGAKAKVKKPKEMGKKTFSKEYKIMSSVPKYFKKLKTEISSKEVAEQFLISVFEKFNINPKFQQFINNSEININNKSKKYDLEVIEVEKLFFDILDLVKPKEALIYVIEGLFDMILQGYLLGKYSKDDFQYIQHDKYDDSYKYRLILKEQSDGKASVDVYEQKLMFNFENKNNTRFTAEYKFISENKYYDKKHGYIMIIKNKLIEKHINGGLRISEFIREDEINIEPLIITEGKTDWKHLKKALERFQVDGFYSNLNIDFNEYEETDMGDAELDSMVRTYSKNKQLNKHIFLFDRDNNRYVKKYGTEEFNYHENNVYSFCIPKISDELDEICIEFYYKKDDIKTKNKEGKRIFIGEEFKGKGDGTSKCGKYFTEKRNAIALDIIDRDKKVFLIDDTGKQNNIALSKNDFTHNIINDVEDFDNFNIEYFKLIFDVIEKIVNDD